MPKAATKKKTKKAEGAPTGVRTAYALFGMSMRESIKSKYPDDKGHDTTMRIAAMWKGLTEAEKTTYIEEANDDKDRFASEMKDFDAGQRFPSKKQDRSKK